MGLAWNLQPLIVAFGPSYRRMLPQAHPSPRPMSRKSESRSVRVVLPEPAMKAPPSAAVARSKRLPLTSNVPPVDANIPPIIPPETSVTLESTIVTLLALSKLNPTAATSMLLDVICKERW